MPSTAIRDHYYEPESRELVITFVTGRVYAYADVPEDVYADFCTARSKGAFFNKRIRDQFRTTELIGD